MLKKERAGLSATNRSISSNLPERAWNWRPELRHAGGLFGGEDPGLPVRDAEAMGEVADRGFSVAGQKLDLHPGGFQGCDGLFGPRAEAVGEGEGVGLAVNRQVGRGHFRRGGPAPVGAAKTDAGAVVGAFDAVAGDFADVGDVGHCDACGLGTFGQRAGERMGGACGESGGRW